MWPSNMPLLTFLNKIDRASSMELRYKLTIFWSCEAKRGSLKQLSSCLVLEEKRKKRKNNLFSEEDTISSTKLPLTLVALVSHTQKQRHTEVGAPTVHHCCQSSSRSSRTIFPFLRTLDHDYPTTQGLLLFDLPNFYPWWHRSRVSYSNLYYPNGS